MRVAYIGPLPPLRSGIADYTARLLPYLCPHFTSTRAVVPDYDPQLPPGVVDEIWRIDLCGENWWDRGRYLPLYQMGNHSTFHDYVYELLVHYPGITVLHDGLLFPFIHARTVETGNLGDYVREAAFEKGTDGVKKALTSLHTGSPLDPEEFPMLRRIIKSSLGVIVHSLRLRKWILDIAPKTKVVVISHPYEHELYAMSRYDSKASLGFSPETCLIGAFGYLAPSKRVDVALRAFARLYRDWPAVRFVCVGQIVQDYDLLKLVAELGISDVVDMVGYVPEDKFMRYLAAVDMAVNLRYPWTGENSGTLISLLGAGVPTLVSDIGSFQELPDEVVLKIPVDTTELDCIEQALRQLLRDRERARQIGDAAQRFVRETANPVKVARQYAAFMRRLI